VVALLPQIIRHPVAGQSRGAMDSAVKPQLFPWYVVGFSLTGLAVTLASFFCPTLLACW
jgi:hypothetical protein